MLGCEEQIGWFGIDPFQNEWIIKPATKKNVVEVPSIATKIRFSEIMLYLSPLPPLLDGFHMAHLMVSIHFAAPRAGQHCGGLQQGRGEVQARKAEHRGSVVEHDLLLKSVPLFVNVGSTQ